MGGHLEQVFDGHVHWLSFLNNKGTGSDIVVINDDTAMAPGLKVGWHHGGGL
jgi:hypothetical protein